MKYNWIYLLLGGLITFYACSSDDAPEPIPEPTPTEPTFNKADSLALTEIYKQGDGANWEVTWDLTDIMSWGGTSWALDTDKNEYRCVMLRIMAKDTGNGIISPQIGELEYLYSLAIGGKTFGGEMPATITNLKFLVDIDLRHTLLTKIPDDMFNENFTYVYIGENKRLGGSLPSSLTKLKGGYANNPERMFRVIYNAYTGEVPLIKNAFISLEGNNLTSLPMELAGRFKAGEHYVSVIRNRLSGIIPDEVLKDTIRIWRFSGQAGLQQEGYGYSNMPSDEEIKKMIEKYKKDHPDFK